MISPGVHFLVTGSSGSLGGTFVRSALAEGHEVTLVLRPDSPPSEFVQNPGIRMIRTDSFAEEELLDGVSETRPDVFLHAAWRGVANSEHAEAFQISDNLPHSLRSVEFAHRVGCRQWIGLGSQAEYGVPNRRINEEEPTRPLSLYGKAKLATGVAAPALADTLGMTGTWLRIFSTYSSHDSPRWLLPFVTRSFLEGQSPDLTGCEQRWDFLHARDAASAILATAQAGAGGIYNLGSGTAPRLRETIETVRTLIGESCPPANYGAVPYRENQVMHLEADISRLTTTTGWQPSVSLESGLGEMIEFLRPEPETCA